MGDKSSDRDVSREFVGTEETQQRAPADPERLIWMIWDLNVLIFKMEQ